MIELVVGFAVVYLQVLNSYIIPFLIPKSNVFNLTKNFFEVALKDDHTCRKLR